jgi:cob(I)alamin adenosyltransferase
MQRPHHRPPNDCLIRYNPASAMHGEICPFHSFNCPGTTVMKIYTRTGDAGTTGLLGGARVPKDDARIAAYGDVDELNAWLGVCRAAELPPEIDAIVAVVQHEMFALGAELASPDSPPRGIKLIGPAEVQRLEQAIDHFEERLTPLRTFILPGGSPAGAALHAARCACRRAERQIVTLGRSAEVRPEALTYVNRLSDLLFVLARSTNAAAGVGDAPWEK